VDYKPRAQISKMAAAATLKIETNQLLPN
jgi:hypothetical protein